MKQTLPFFVLLCSLLISAQAAATDSLVFVNPWIPEAPPAASVMAGYMQINNPGTKDIDIISISSASFKSVEMHQSIETDGFAKMLPQKKLSIAAGGQLELKPGSYHLMLIKPVKWFKHGDKIKLEIKLSNSEITSLEMSIKKNSARKMKCAAGKCGG